MIYELRTYQLVVGKLPEYLQTVKTKMLPVLAEHGHDAIKRVGFIRNANVKLQQEQLGSCALWIKPVERNRPVKLLRLSMGIVRRTLGWNTDTRAWVMQ